MSFRSRIFAKYLNKRLNFQRIKKLTLNIYEMFSAVINYSKLICLQILIQIESYIKLILIFYHFLLIDILTIDKKNEKNSLCYSQGSRTENYCFYK